MNGPETLTDRLLAMGAPSRDDWIGCVFVALVFVLLVVVL